MLNLSAFTYLFLLNLFWLVLCSFCRTDNLPNTLCLFLPKQSSQVFEYNAKVMCVLIWYMLLLVTTDNESLTEPPIAGLQTSSNPPHLSRKTWNLSVLCRRWIRLTLTSTCNLSLPFGPMEYIGLLEWKTNLHASGFHCQFFDLLYYMDQR